MDGAEPQTLSIAVYARLRQEIVDGMMEPGGKLRIGDVSARYGVTSTPVREALSQLTSEGFVLRRPQRGFTVATASNAELQELTQTRCWVEELALRQAMQHATRAWEEGIVLALHRCPAHPAPPARTFSGKTRLGRARITTSTRPCWPPAHRVC